jgi:hypothetical protein
MVSDGGLAWLTGVNPDERLTVHWAVPLSVKSYCHGLSLHSSCCCRASRSLAAEKVNGDVMKSKKSDDDSAGKPGGRSG